MANILIDKNLNEVNVVNGTYVGSNRMLIKPVWGGLLFAKANDMSLTPFLTIEGMIEPNLTKYILNTIKPGMKVIDVGANIGYYTVMLGHMVGDGGWVHSFEANPEIYAILKDNIKANYINKRATANLNAVYSKKEKLTFYVEEQFNGNSSIFEPGKEYFTQFGENSIKKIEALGIPLDEHFKGSDEVFDLVKIDVEGGEFEVFKGMKELLVQGRIKEVVFEWNQLRADTTEFRELLKELQNERGFTFYLLDKESQTRFIDVQSIFETEFIDTVLMRKLT